MNDLDKFGLQHVDLARRWTGRAAFMTYCGLRSAGAGAYTVRIEVK